MKNFVLATAALSLPTASYSFMTSVKQTHVRAPSSLFQQQYYDQGGQYYEGEGQQSYDQSQYEQQQYYDQGQQNYAQDPQQQYQQQQYPGQQQQGGDPNMNYNQGQEPSLLVNDNMQEEMARATNGVELGGIDYLALARQRAAARVQSNNSQSSDADWHQLAEEKRQQMGSTADEDWEKSLEDEGSSGDSAALGMGVQLEQYGEGGALVTEGGLVVDNAGEGGDGPQLLL